GPRAAPRLALPPHTNAPPAPTTTSHVNATAVNRNTNRIAASPAIIPAKAPFALAPRSSVPNKNRPSKLPNGIDATVSPASSNGPHFTNPNAINTVPQISVIPRESRRNFSGSADLPRSREKSRTLNPANEFSDPLASD